MAQHNSEKDLTFGYFLIQAFFWGQYAVLLGYTSMYLLDHSFSNAAIGMVLAVAGVASALLQPMVAAYADRPESVSVKKLLLILTVIVMALAAGLLVTGQLTFATGLLYGCGIALLQLMTPLINALGMETLNQGKKLNFGFARGGGSIAYALGSYLIGVLAERIGTVVVPIGMLIYFGGLLAALLIFPFEKTSRQKGQTRAADGTNTGNTGSDGADAARPAASSGQGTFLRRYPRFAAVLLGMVLLYTSHALINNFAFQIVSSKGGGSAETGTGMAIAAVIEMVPMFLFSFMLRKARVDIWFRIAGIFFTLKTAATYLAPNIPAYYGAQFFQIFGWGLVTVSAVYYVNSVVKSEDAIKGQAYMTMTFTLGSVLGSAVGGRLMDVGGVSAMLLFGIGAAAVGMVIVLLSAERSVDPEKAAGQGE